MYGTNQVGELIIGSAVATETTVQTFIDTASDKEIGIFSEDGSDVALNKPFKVLQKTNGDASKNLNYEFSTVVNPKYVDRITVSSYAPEVQKTVSISGFTGNVLANHTYEVEIRMYNDGGSLSPENFAVIQGYYVTGASIANETDITIKDGLVKSLTKNLKSRGNGEFTVTSGNIPVQITIQSKEQKVVPGKIEGRLIEFDVFAKVYQNIQDLTQPQQNLGLLEVATIFPYHPGVGTGKLAVNYEWFTSGNKYEVYRTTGYPADFNTPYYANINGTYDVIDITHYAPRNETSVERQYKQLRIMIDTTVSPTGKDLLVDKLDTITGLTLLNPGTNLV